MTNWKRKLAAFRHDPPSKCLDIRTHGDRSDAAFRQAGFSDNEIGDHFAHADHAGAAANRSGFPKAGSICGNVHLYPSRCRFLESLKHSRHD